LPCFPTRRQTEPLAGNLPGTPPAAGAEHSVLAMVDHNSKPLGNSLGVVAEPLPRSFGRSAFVADEATRAKLLALIHLTMRLELARDAATPLPLHSELHA